jgi:UDPglucose 6-dehydrogenase
MNIAIIGSGYVGLVTGACFADFGHNVMCVDADVNRVALLARGEIPFFEPGLAELVQRNGAVGRLQFTSDLELAVKTSPVIFLAVGTPEGRNGAADLSQVSSAVAAIATHIDGYRIIVTKSTVPVGTGCGIRELMRRHLRAPIEFDVVSNPEFLREGSAIEDFMRPDRIVIGTDSARAAAVIREIYRPLYLIETPFIITDIASAEMIKYASNALLAVKISFMNEIANLCDEVGADVHVVAKGMGLDKRLGPKFLHPGPGYGGSCFPKDTRALAAMGTRFGTRQHIVESAIHVNDTQRERLFRKIERAVGGLWGRRIAVLGLAFKPNTSDVREAPAVYLCRELAAAGATIRAFDPIAVETAARELEDLGDSIEYAADAYEAATGADAVVIMTEWNEFRNLELATLHSLVASPVLVDARNVLDPARVRAVGFRYVCTGRERAADGHQLEVPVSPEVPFAMLWEAPHHADSGPDPVAVSPKSFREGTATV